MTVIIDGQLRRSRNRERLRFFGTATDPVLSATQAERDELPMRINRLEHYNIRTTKLEETVQFYDDIVGMKCRRSPMAPENMPATWIYDDSGIPVVHLTPVDPQDPPRFLLKNSTVSLRAHALIRVRSVRGSIYIRP